MRINASTTRRNCSTSYRFDHNVSFRINYKSSNGHACCRIYGYSWKISPWSLRNSERYNVVACSREKPAYDWRNEPSEQITVNRRIFLTPLQAFIFDPP
jgi:hypothetical protein